MYMRNNTMFYGYLSKPKGIRERKRFGEHWCNVTYFQPVANVADVIVSNPLSDHVIQCYNICS